MGRGAFLVPFFLFALPAQVLMIVRLISEKGLALADWLCCASEAEEPQGQTVVRTWLAVAACG